MNDHPNDAPDALDQLADEPDDLDGHTLAELADYLDSGRNPVDLSIESSASCQHALAALLRLRTVARQVLQDPTEESDEDESWVTAVMDRIAMDAHAGRDIHLASGPPQTRIVITEGAVKALIRSTGDDLPGMLVGRIDLDGDLGAADAPITITMQITILYGAVIEPVVEALRNRVQTAIRQHTSFVDPTLNIIVQDLHVRTRGAVR